MKYIKSAIFLSLMTFGVAMATTKTPAPTTSTQPAPVSSSTSSIVSNPSSESTSSSYSGSETGPSYSASEAGDVNNTTSSKFLNFPQPVWTTVPAPYGCLVTESTSGALGWNFISGSGSKQYSETVCTTIRMAEAATLHCQFATAAYLNKNAFEEMYPKKNGDFFLLGNPENLSPVACDEMKRPKLKVEQNITLPVLSLEPTVCVEPQKTYIKKSAKAKPKMCK